MSKPAAADLAQMIRWCCRHVAAHIDDCNEVDVTGLALACAAAHGDDDPREGSPVWEAASSAAAEFEDAAV